MSVYGVPIHKATHRLGRFGLDTRFCYGFVDLDLVLIGWAAYVDCQIGTDLAVEDIDSSIDGPIFHEFLSREPGSTPPLPILIALLEGST